MQISKIINILCIPRMETFISTDFIRETIDNHNIGKIKKIIELPHKNNPKFKRVLIHMWLYENSPAANQLRDRFQEKKDVKIMYYFPWFWKIVEANNMTTVNNNQPQTHTTQTTPTPQTTQLTLLTPLPQLD